MDAFAHAYQRQIPPIVLARDVGSHQRPNAGRIHIWDVAEINDQRVGRIGPHRGLELKHRGHHQRPFQAAKHAVPAALRGGRQCEENLGMAEILTFA